MAMRILMASVGEGGVNRRGDTALVQLLLNVDRYNARRVRLLSVDGAIGPGTIGAIQEFQRIYLKMRPDGLIEPHGLTIKALAFCWCSWLRASKSGNYPPPNFPPDPTGWYAMPEQVDDAVQGTLVEIRSFLESLLPAASAPRPGPSPQPDDFRPRPDLEEFRPRPPVPDVA